MSSEKEITSGDEDFQVKRNLWYPALFVLFLWLIEGLAIMTGERWISLGILPRTVTGLLGIVTAPFIHSDAGHLLSNTLPLLLIGTGMIYFYRKIAWQVIRMVWLFSGIWVWLSARQEYHIGASGLVYGFVTFLFFSGLIRKDVRLTAISLLVTFLYGSMVWGILPIDQRISWESHLYGALAGLISAIYYRKEGPRRPKPQWEIDEEAERESALTDESPAQSGESEQLIPDSPDDPPIRIQYHYKEKNDSAEN